jgi:hypothetical protein
MASDAHFDNRGWNAFCGCLVVGFAMVATERLVVGRWWVGAGGPLGKQKNEVGGGWRGATAAEKWSFIIDLLFSPRGVNRAWAAKNIPHFRSSDPAYVPTRAAFLRRRLTSTLISFLLFDVIANSPPPDPSMFSLSTIPFFRRLDDVTSSELALRLSSTLAFWISTYCIVNVINGVFALFCVGLGVSEAKDWPPIFGAVGEASSVRRFWGWLCPLSWSFFPQAGAEIANSYPTPAHFGIKSTAPPSKVSPTPSPITSSISAPAPSYHGTPTSPSASSSRASST